MWWVTAAGLALLVLPAATKELFEELPQAQDPDLINYDEYDPYGGLGMYQYCFFFLA